jgi:hypothetical protein
MHYGEKPPISPSEVLAQLDRQNAERQGVMRMRLVKECGLDMDTEVAIKLRNGKSIAEVELFEKGVRVRFGITSNSISEISRSSLNDTESGAIAALEDELVRNLKVILEDYFANFPEDRPE